ncbi:hypothetical protein L596_021420 [Steinernema carpocapsae]|uniref:Uncharacterized protein n=1 Tax=Steinernema carpocapsae TaxID=34508 RepID=A0A4U5MIP6_STECR|nr:hypothetical protein L596_021420 [Steinernema carpocapsae]
MAFTLENAIIVNSENNEQKDFVSQCKARKQKTIKFCPNHVRNWLFGGFSPETESPGVETVGISLTCGYAGPLVAAEFQQNRPSLGSGF